MTNHPDDRSTLAVAVALASHVTTIAMEMALPALLGHWLDRWLNTGFVFVLLGAILGFLVGMWHLLQFSRNVDVGGSAATNHRSTCSAPPDRHDDDPQQMRG